MFNPDFWEVRLDPQDLDQYANEAGLWFESRGDACLNCGSLLDDPKPLMVRVNK